MASQPLETELKKYLKNYSKSDKDLFFKIENNLDKAIERARKIIQQQTENKADNPSTTVYELVEYLRSLKFGRV